MMTTRRTGGDETWRLLLDWTGSQKRSERMAAALLREEGYESVDPSHPLGGPDGLKDAIAIRNGTLWIMAVYFPREKQTFNAILEKFQHDLKGVAKNGANGIAFVTNQELTLAERKVLRDEAAPTAVDIFHLERVASLLNSPKCYGIRLEYLDLEMTKDEQLAYFAAREEREGEKLQRLEGLITGGGSYCWAMITLPHPNDHTIMLMLIHEGTYPLYDVHIRVCDLEKLDEIKRPGLTINAAQLEYCDSKFDVGNLAPGAHTPLGIFDLGSSDYRRFNIFYTCRNGKYTQLLRARRVDGEWLFATRVERGLETLIEFVDEHYPRNDNGEVAW